jgi:hypothetical protein
MMKRHMDEYTLDPEKVESVTKPVIKINHKLYEEEKETETDEEIEEQIIYDKSECSDIPEEVVEDTRHPDLEEDIDFGRYVIYY